LVKSRSRLFLTALKSMMDRNSESGFLFGYQQLPRAILISFTITISSCAAKTPPLAIRMYNPKTNQTLHCMAREQSGQHTDILAATVESCARQLEANGFVREN